MRIQQVHGSTKIWLSARETYAWANRDGARWPCSQLADRRLFAEFDRNGDVVDISIDGGRGEQDCDANEFNACITDHLRRKNVKLVPASLQAS